MHDVGPTVQADGPRSSSWNCNHSYTRSHDLCNILMGVQCPAETHSHKTMATTFSANAAIIFQQLRNAQFMFGSVNGHFIHFRLFNIPRVTIPHLHGWIFTSRKIRISKQRAERGTAVISTIKINLLTTMQSANETVDYVNEEAAGCNCGSNTIITLRRYIPIGLAMW